MSGDHAPGSPGGDELRPHGPAWLGTCPPERCYWALLPAAASELPAAYRFEGSLPFPVEGLQCSFAHLPDGRVLAAGMEIAAVQRHLDQPGGSQIWVLRPAGLPACLEGRTIGSDAVEQLNFLAGTCMARPVRRHRRIMTGLLTAAAILAAIVLVGGGWRAAAAWEADIARLEAERLAMAEVAAPAQQGGTELPATARLLQAYRQAQAGRGSLAAPTVDALLLVDAACRGLPPGGGVAITELSADQQRVLMRVGVKDLEALRSLTEAVSEIRSPDGTVWPLEPVDLPSGRKTPFSIQLAWRPRPGGGSP